MKRLKALSSREGITFPTASGAPVDTVFSLPTNSTPRPPPTAELQQAARDGSPRGRSASVKHIASPPFLPSLSTTTRGGAVSSNQASPVRSPRLDNREDRAKAVGFSSLLPNNHPKRIWEVESREKPILSASRQFWYEPPPPRPPPRPPYKTSYDLIEEMQLSWDTPLNDPMKLVLTHVRCSTWPLSRLVPERARSLDPTDSPFLDESTLWRCQQLEKETKGRRTRIRRSICGEPRDIDTRLQAELRAAASETLSRAQDQPLR